MACAESARLALLEDGELAPPEAAALERHVATCADCRLEREATRALRAALRRSAERHRAPAALRARIGAALEAEPAPFAATRRPPPATAPRGRFWAGAGSGALAATLAALAVALVVGRGATPAVEHDVVAAHLRALLPGRAIDVESSDRHTVKPWFAGHADVSPPVVDFAAEGFVLAGGRIDYVGGERASVVVYRHGAHLIDVFVWRDPAARQPTRARSENGFRLLSWRAGDLAFCAISDTAEAELVALKDLLRQSLPGDARE
ncbi:MAG: zf-HC2 domain-containing protein [Proteobacteria bacterium]|nr:zf-HC2 domain-containing protein [Pseudomonadota bacterium]